MVAGRLEVCLSSGLTELFSEIVGLKAEGRLFHNFLLNKKRIKESFECLDASRIFYKLRTVLVLSQRLQKDINQLKCLHSAFHIIPIVSPNDRRHGAQNCYLQP